MFDILRSVQKEQEELLAESAAEMTGQVLALAGPDSVNLKAGSGNLMSRNFFNSSYEKSRYTVAKLEGFEQERSRQSKLTNLVGLMQADYAVLKAQREARLTGGGGISPTTVDPKYILSYIAGKRGMHTMSNIENEEAVEASEEALEKNRDRIEEKAREALTPTEEFGNPIGIPAGNAGDADPMPEIASGSTPAQTPAPAPAPAADVSNIAAGSARAPELAIPIRLTPSTPSIDITV